MRLFVTGWDGLLGSSLVPLLQESHEVTGVGIQDGDIADGTWLFPRVSAFRPDWIIHLAAMTAVDACEEAKDEAYRVNEEGSAIVAEAAFGARAGVLGVSTDYVFDGKKQTPYGVEDPVNPLSVYGHSKWLGEEALGRYDSRWAVVRSAWLYGPGGKSFVSTIRNLLNTRETIKVVDDQVGSPTYTEDLARLIEGLVRREPEGIYHGVNRGEASWFEFAQEIALCFGFDPNRIQPTSTEEFGRPAPRPPYSVLDGSRAENVSRVTMRSWKDAVHHFIENQSWD